MLLKTVASLLFEGEDISPELFMPIFQQGFMVEVQVGINVKSLMTGHFGLSPTYIEERICTAFLDGKPIDDFETTIVEQGSTLALSAAMPGLVGATLRKGGGLAVFRSTITHQNIDSRKELKIGIVHIKLFNLLVKELGIVFLRHGIYIESVTAHRFFSAQTEHFWLSCKSAGINGIDLSRDQLAEKNWADMKGLIYIRVDY